MLDFLRDLTKSAEEKRQEMLTAYVDGALSPRHISAFEQQLSQDPELQAEVEQMQQHKLMMRQLPRRRVPRNFTLDPALYSLPQRQPLLQLYPAMRMATVLTAVFLIIAVSAELLTPLRSANFAASEAAAPIAMQDTVTESETASEIIIEEESAFANAAGELFEEEMAEEPSVAEAAMEESLVETDTDAFDAAALGAADAEMFAGESEEMEEEEAEPPSNDEMAEIQIAATPSKPELEVQITEQVADADDETAPAQTTTSSSPRITETAVSERAVVTTSPAATEIAAVAPTATVQLEVEEIIAIVPFESPPVRQTLTTLRVVQIGLAVLLLLLITAVYYTRRKL